MARTNPSIHGAAAEPPVVFADLPQVPPGDELPPAAVEEVMYFLLLPSRSLDEEHLRIICRSLFAQIDHIFRYPSVYTSPNTHLIGESALLYIASVLFPEWPRAAMWGEFSTRTLRDEMQKQVLSDGVYGDICRAGNRLAVGRVW